MPSSLDLVVLLGSAWMLLSFSYAAYWAFGIRRALALRVYRNQALGIGLVAVIVVVLFLFFSLTVAYDFQLFLARTLTPFIAVWQGSIVALQIVIFYWIDASLLAARRSDPLLRDTFRWSHLRILFWALLFGMIAVNIPFYFAFASGFGFVSQLIGLGPVSVILISGAVILPVAALRSKDAFLRRNLAWFAVFVAVLFGSVLFGGFFSDLFQKVSEAFFSSLPGAYFLYRSIRALAPINRIDQGELTSATRLDIGAVPSPAVSQFTHARH